MYMSPKRILATLQAKRATTTTTTRSWGKKKHLERMNENTKKKKTDRIEIKEIAIFFTREVTHIPFSKTNNTKKNKTKTQNTKKKKKKLKIF